MKNLKFNDYCDLYGALLTDKQQRILSNYYAFDLSLSEIADNEGITRQGVLDAIKTAEKELLKYENALGLDSLTEKIRKAAVNIKECLKSGNTEKIEELADKILTLI